MIADPQLAAAACVARSTEPTVLDLIDRQAARLPQKTALLDGSQRISYATLLAAADLRARWLAARGVTVGALVGIGLDRSLEMVAWVLAILKTGAAYVPLDPKYPPDRLRFVVEDAGLRLAVVDPAATWAAALPLELICAEEPSAFPAGGEVQPFPSRATPDGTAYVIYTSGSTGTPKGVEVSHAALGAFVRMVPAALGIREDDVWMLTAATSYAVHVRQLLTPLTVGATIAVASEGDLRDPRVLLASAQHLGVTLMDFVPSYWRTCNRVLAALPPAERAPLLANSLRQIVSVGEPLTYDLPRTWRHTFGHPAAIVNILGQTETTGMFTAYRLPEDLRHGEGVVPVGAPLPGVELHLLDADGRPVAGGEPGEVYLSTPCLARGYLHRPELTAQRFLPHPTAPGARLYRTGDLARYRAGGALQHLGRCDQQVKVRGKRVDLVEVETYLRLLPGVGDAAAVAVQNEDAETEIAGYVAADAPAPLTLQEIWAQLRLHLPEHALPGRVYRLDALPYLPNGKLDRQALAHAAGTLPHAADAAPAEALPHGSAGPCLCERSGQSLTLTAIPAGRSGSGAAGGAAACQAAAHLQAQVAEVWLQVLRVEQVCCEDDFFARGGTSLQAALLAAHLERTLGRRVPVDLIYRAPTVATLALALARLPADTTVAAEDPSTPLVLLRSGGDWPPLLLAHGLGGGVVGYADLVQHLPGSFPVYGLQAAGLDGEAPPDTTIGSMAARYVRALHSIQPQGPYRLGGYCYGGVLAFEMARQLAAAGEEPALVAIVEGYAPGWRGRRTALLHPHRLRLLAKNMPFWWQEYRTLGGDVLRRRLARKLRPPAAPCQEVGGCANGAAQALVDDDLSALPAYRQRLLDAHTTAIRTYAPAPYSGHIIVLRGRDRTISQVLREPLDADLGWRGLAAGVTVDEIPGAHRNVHLAPYARGLAAALGQYLAHTEGYG